MIDTLPNSRMNPSAAPVTRRFPLWLKAVQLMATGSGLRENWTWGTETKKKKKPTSDPSSFFTHDNEDTDWLLTCCLTVLVSQSSSCPETVMGSRGAESLLPERLRAAAEQTKDEPLGLQASDNMLEDTQKVQVGIKRANCDNVNGNIML